MFDRMKITYDLDYSVTSAKEAASDCKRLENCGYRVEETAASTGYHIRAEKQIKREVEE